MLRNIVISALMAAMMAILSAPSQASKTCSDAAVSARGEPARFLWLAKTKARANWRRKVRATPTLGTDFSNWGNAETSEERCITAEGGTVCIFTGYPCKR
ncbi:MAG: hypothetical protein K2Q28_04925 [Hyphomicrobium sp.]|nr:hypothetical protein [Hyphomicrobium sp.]